MKLRIKEDKDGSYYKVMWNIGKSNFGSQTFYSENDVTDFLKTHILDGEVKVEFVENKTEQFKDNVKYSKDFPKKEGNKTTTLTKQGKDDIKKNGITTIDNTVRDVNK